MRIAVVYFTPRSNSPVIAMAKAIASGIESQGHQVDIIDGFTDQTRKLIMYQYIIIGTEQIGFFGKIHDKIGHYLSSQGTVQGKKGFAFVAQKIFGTPRALLRLMSVMEKEGIMVKCSEIFTSRRMALETGKYLIIK
jgi:menaquinone-dependent protoporphyrinogen IX oxidase